MLKKFIKSTHKRMKKNTFHVVPEPTFNRKTLGRHSIDVFDQGSVPENQNDQI